MSVRRLFFDIETSPCVGWFWRPGYNLNLDYNNILENAKIICICYKWEGSRKTYSLTWDSKKNDKKMLQDFIKVLNQANEVIGHNSDKFDIKWIRTRCLIHGIDMMPEYTSIDTLKEARKGFNFPSNRLDSIGRYTGVGKKIKTTGELWYDTCFKNNRTALDKMVKYCIQDVVLLEKVYAKMHNFIKPKYRFNTDKHACPRCGSEDLRVKANKISGAGVRFKNMQCANCGTYSKVTEKKVKGVK
jgi:ribosomal protein S27AE